MTMVLVNNWCFVSCKIFTTLCLRWFSLIHIGQRASLHSSYLQKRIIFRWCSVHSSYSESCGLRSLRRYARTYLFCEKLFTPLSALCFCLSCGHSKTLFLSKFPMQAWHSVQWQGSILGMWSPSSSYDSKQTGHWVRSFISSAIFSSGNGFSNRCNLSRSTPVLSESVSRSESNFFLCLCGVHITLRHSATEPQ